MSEISLILPRVLSTVTIIMVSERQFSSSGRDVQAEQGDIGDVLVRLNAGGEVRPKQGGIAVVAEKHPVRYRPRQAKMEMTTSHGEHVHEAALKRLPTWEDQSRKPCARSSSVSCSTRRLLV